MDYPVKHFESDDAGAPSLDRTLPGSLIQVLKQCLIEGYNLQPFDSLEMEEGEGKANFSGNHGFRVHQVIEISGAAGSDWNGEHRVTAVGTQWIRFEVDGEPAGESGSGLEIQAAPVGGWEIAHISAEEDRAAFRSTDPASTGMYFYLDDRRSADIESPPSPTSTDLDFRLLRGAEAMPDIDTRTDGWGEGWVFVGASSRGDEIPYDIIADSRTVYLITHAMVDGSDEMRCVHAFGDFVSSVPGDAYAAFLVLATAGDPDDNDDGDNVSEWAQLTSNSHKRLARCIDEIDQNVAFSMRGHGRSEYFGYGGYDYPNPANLELLVHAPILVHESDSVMRGRVPGVAQPLQSAPLPSREVVSLAGRHFKAITHAHTVTLSPSAAQTFFDLTGPWGRE